MRAVWKGLRNLLETVGSVSAGRVGGSEAGEGDQACFPCFSVQVAVGRCLGGLFATEGIDQNRTETWERVLEYWSIGEEEQKKFYIGSS